MDAFFAAVEQAAKPSLRGKPVVVGGLGPRGVVATASYEARRFGVRSAMPMGQARRLAPNAAYLTPRFALYREVSMRVMELLGRLSPLVEPLSLDEAFVDLEAGGSACDAGAARAVGERLRRDIVAATGLTASVGLAGSKMLAKIASEQAKPDGLVLIEPGTERELLAPMGVRTLPGVGPATEEHLRRAGMTTVAHLAEAGEDELVRLLGRAHGAALHAMALGQDDRPVVGERDAKSVSVEDTFDVDLHDRARVRWEVERLAERCVGRLRAAGRSGRTVVLKVRRYDFSTLTRSETLRGPTDDPAVVREAAARLLDAVDTTGGVRLLGVGVSGLADYTQEDLFAQAAAEEAARAAAGGAGETRGAAGGAGEAAAAAEESWDAPGRSGRGEEVEAARGGGGRGAVGRLGVPWPGTAARERRTGGAVAARGPNRKAYGGGGTAGWEQGSDAGRPASAGLPGAGGAAGEPDGPARELHAGGVPPEAGEDGRGPGGSGPGEMRAVHGGSGEPGRGPAFPGPDPGAAAEPVEERGAGAGAAGAGPSAAGGGREARGGDAGARPAGGTGAAGPGAGGFGAGGPSAVVPSGGAAGVGGGGGGPADTGGCRAGPFCRRGRRSGPGRLHRHHGACRSGRSRGRRWARRHGRGRTGQCGGAAVDAGAGRAA